MNEQNNGIVSVLSPCVNPLLHTTDHGLESFLDSAWIYDFSEIGNDLSCFWLLMGVMLPLLT